MWIKNVTFFINWSNTRMLSDSQWISQWIHEDMRSRFNVLLRLS